jgi:DNA-directed RNA polymerase subunit RPC12/RpoP
MTCRKCKIPMEEIKGHLFHKQRKWRCPKCAAIRMQKPRKPSSGHPPAALS